MSAGPTPGPWRVDRLSETGAVFVKPVPGQIVCEVEPGPQQAANAALLAAAPALANALRNLLREVNLMGQGGTLETADADAALALLEVRP